MPAILKNFLPYLLASLCDIASFGSYAKVRTFAEHDDLQHDEVSHLVGWSLQKIYNQYEKVPIA